MIAQHSFPTLKHKVQRVRDKIPPFPLRRIQFDQLLEFIAAIIVSRDLALPDGGQRMLEDLLPGGRHRPWNVRMEEDNVDSDWQSDSRTD